MSAPIKTIQDALKALHPELRRKGVVGITKSTGSRKVYSCAYCRAQESQSARWPVTQRVINFKMRHNRDCEPLMIRQAQAWANTSSGES